jgi:single-strand DNA-binding protein
MVNKVILIGNLGKDPETKTFDNGEMARFSVATSESYKDQTGEWQEKTEWHNIVAFGNKAEQAKKLQKGTTIYLEGKLTHRTKENDQGEKRTFTSIQVNYMRIVSKPQQEQRQAQGGQQGWPEAGDF